MSLGAGEGRTDLTGSQSTLKATLLRSSLQAGLPHEQKLACYQEADVRLSLKQVRNFTLTATCGALARSILIRTGNQGRARVPDG